MVLSICGTAHPPPRGSRQHVADLNGAEIGTTQLAGAPLLEEHTRGQRIGTCLASWERRDGSLRVTANVHDEDMARRIRSGEMRGLSLGTDMVSEPGGKILYKGQAELSVCAEGRRDNTWIDTINGETVHRRYNASMGGLCVCARVCVIIYTACCAKYASRP